MKIKKGDTVTLNYIDLDDKMRKVFGKKMPNSVEGVVDEISKTKDGKVWFTLEADKGQTQVEMYPVDRIVKINGKRI
jgi:hypothetical protein